MPELFDDRRELNESLEHKIAIYGLPLVLERLGAVVATSDTLRVAVRAQISVELEDLGRVAQAALDA